MEKITQFLSNLPQKTDEEEILPNSCMKPALFNTKPHKDIAKKQTNPQTNVSHKLIHEKSQ